MNNRISSAAKICAATMLFLVLAFMAIKAGKPATEPQATSEPADEIKAAIAAEKLTYDRELQSVRDQAARQIAAAEAKVTKAQLEIQAAQGADFQAGVAAGKAQAEAALDAKLELARTREFERGRILGAAEAEADATERGRRVGEEIGRLKAADEARKAFEADVQLAIERTRSETHEESFRKGLHEGKALAERTGRLEASIPGICMAIAVLTFGFYVLLRRRQLEVDRTHSANWSRRDTVEEKLQLLINQSQHALGHPGEQRQ